MTEEELTAPSGQLSPETITPIELAPKIRKAAQILLAQRGLSPGAKGWELKKLLGRNYMAVIDGVNVELDRLGLMVKIQFSDDSQDPDDARFFVVFKDPPPAGISLGMRIDDIAMLAASLAYIKAKGGKCPRLELENMLRERFPKWRVLMGLRRFEKMGYLDGVDGVYHFGWRTKAEVNLNALSTLIAAMGPAGTQNTKM